MSLSPANWRLYVGLLLTAAGVVYLLQNFGVLPFAQWLWAGGFALGAMTFVALYLNDRAQWWALIPAGALAGLCLTVLIGQLDSRWAALGGSAFLGCLGLGFGAVYALHRDHWWSLIPGGALITLAVVAGVSDLGGGLASGGIFFIGLGLTFALVALLPNPPPPMRWAWIPAGVLLALGVLAFFGALSLWNWLGPIALIAAGVFLLIRTLRK
jgi:hypothetical protein